jgi:uncharacterized protein YndB with AHSA1/START domain
MDNIRLIALLPAPPEQVYDTWLSSLGHTSMTASPATSEPHIGGRHTAWDGYISGEHVELEPGRRILQTWRTTEFPEGAPDSLLEIVFTRDTYGTRLTLIQNGIPDGHGEKYYDGWQEHYFAPMRAHFATSNTTYPFTGKSAGTKAKTAKPTLKAKTAKPTLKAKTAKPTLKAKAAAPVKKAAKAKPTRPAKKAKTGRSVKAASVKKTAKKAKAASRKKTAKKARAAAPAKKTAKKARAASRKK